MPQEKKPEKKQQRALQMFKRSRLLLTEGAANAKRWLTADDKAMQIQKGADC